MPKRKAWPSPVPTGDTECHSQEAEIQLRGLGGEPVRWLASGMAAPVFGHFMGDLLSQRQGNPAAVDRNLNMYFH